MRVLLLRETALRAATGLPIATYAAHMRVTTRRVLAISKYRLMAIISLLLSPLSAQSTTIPSVDTFMCDPGEYITRLWVPLYPRHSTIVEAGTTDESVPIQLPAGLIAYDRAEIMSFKRGGTSKSFTEFYFRTADEPLVLKWISKLRTERPLPASEAPYSIVDPRPFSSVVRTTWKGSKPASRWVYALVIRAKRCRVVLAWHGAPNYPVIHEPKNDPLFDSVARDFYRGPSSPVRDEDRLIWLEIYCHPTADKGR